MNVFFMLIRFSLFFITLNSYCVATTLDIAIEWHIPVGCGFSGFYVEFLGISSHLATTLPELRVVSGPCSLEFYTQLFTKETQNFRRIYDSSWALETSTSSVHTPPDVIQIEEMEHGIDMPGGDLPRASDGYLVTSVSECNYLCIKTPACVGWTVREEDLKCWLKAKHTNKVNQLGLVSRTMPHRQPLPRIDVWHGRCDVSEITKSQRDGIFVIARLMTESNSFRNTPGVLECALAADAVWVPTKFHQNLFKNHGVSESSIVIIPEAVDPQLFIRGEEETMTNKKDDFVFLSVFKWEKRKGWDVLLDAYWQAFDLEDDVVLRLRCWKPSWEYGSNDIDQQISNYATSKKRSKTGQTEKRRYSRSELARVEWIGSADYPHAEELTRTEMRSLYAKADCFVLATRGEGWGLPAAEAMTMGIPTIVTNFSGPTGFATKETSYLIPVTDLDRAGFANIDTGILAELLQEAFMDSANGQGKMKGIAARERMIELFSPQMVGSAIVDQFTVIADSLIQASTFTDNKEEL